MDWFKHPTGSHEDPDISDAEDKFGPVGYVAFFKILEIYGREFRRIDRNGGLELSKSKLSRNLRMKWKRIRLVLGFYQRRKRIFFSETEKRIVFNIPKFITMASNWTKRESKAPTEAPTEAPTAREEEVEKEEEKKKNKEKELEEKECNSSQATSSPNSISSNIVFSCSFFEIKEDYIEKLLNEYPGINLEFLLRLFSKIEDYVSDRKEKYKRDVRGRLKNPKSVIRNWLEKEILIPDQSRGNKSHDRGAGIKEWLRRKQDNAT